VEKEKNSNVGFGIIAESLSVLRLLTTFNSHLQFFVNSTLLIGRFKLFVSSSLEQQQHDFELTFSHANNE